MARQWWCPNGHCWDDNGHPEVGRAGSPTCPVCGRTAVPVSAHAVPVVVPLPGEDGEGPIPGGLAPPLVVPETLGRELPVFPRGTRKAGPARPTEWPEPVPAEPEPPLTVK